MNTTKILKIISRVCPDCENNNVTCYESGVEQDESGNTHLICYECGGEYLND